MAFSADLTSMVSVVVPCYNQAEFLSEALESVLHQSYTDWECIIVNDGSPDATHSVATDWCNRDKRFSYLSKQNGGLASARNAGIEAARGKYIFCLDADDYIGEEYLQMAAKTFEENESIALVYCLAQKFGYENGPWELQSYDYQSLLLNNIIFCSALYKKEDWIKAGKYDEHLRNGWEDWAFWVKLLNFESKVVRLPEVLFYYRTKESSMIRHMDPKQKDEVRWFIFKNQMQKYQEWFASPIYYINTFNETEQKCRELENENAFLKKKLTEAQELSNR